MSQFRNMVENILQKENNINLFEALTYSLKVDNPYLNNGLQKRFIVLKNPNKEELENFKNNSEYNCVRGFIKGTNPDIYICDAAIGTHDMLYDTLAQNNKVDKHGWHEDFIINADDTVDGSSNNAVNFIRKKYNLKHDRSQLSALALESLWLMFYKNPETDADESDWEYVKNNLHIDPEIISYDRDKPSDQRDNFITWYKKVKPYLPNNIK